MSKRDCINCKYCEVHRYMKFFIFEVCQEWRCQLGSNAQVKCMFAGTEDYFKEGKPKFKRRRMK